MRTEKKIRQELKDLFEEDNTLFNDTIEELDSYNGYLGDDRYYFMEEIDELLSDYNVTDILYRVLCGYNQDEYTTDGYGEKHYGSFNPNCDYFKFNGYGNLYQLGIKIIQIILTIISLTVCLKTVHI